MEHNKIVSLITKIANKTINSELVWEVSPNSKSFYVSFKNYSITIEAFSSAQYDGDDYRFIINNDFGDIIEQVVDSDFKDDAPEVMAQLKTLFDNARRQAMGVDKAIDDIIKELGDDDFPI